MELITLMFNTSSNFDNNNDNDTPHDNAEDSELMSPQTPSAAQDQVTRVDTNASKIHSNSTFAEFENLRCSGLHKLHKFASGNNNVIYCIHCDTLLEDSIYIYIYYFLFIEYYACKGKKCNNYFCENCYKDIPNGLCDTCYASEQNRINLMHKKLHQIKKSSKKTFVVQTFKQEEIENKFEENEKAKTWINGTVFSVYIYIILFLSIPFLFLSLNHFLSFSLSLYYYLFHLLLLIVIPRFMENLKNKKINLRTQSL